jgi:hypothetical protein
MRVFLMVMLMLSAQTGVSVLHGKASGKGACSADSADTLVCATDQVQVLMHDLLSDARSGFEHREEAAFIVRAASGNYYSIEWPSNGELDSARWVGTFPAGTVAIAHTHPTHLPNPSGIDVTVARHVHVPV